MLGTRLKILRKEQGLLQTDVASACGVSRTNISHWEKSGHIPDEHIEKVASLLGLTVESFRKLDKTDVDAEVRSALGKTLRIIREEKGINQASVAEAAGVYPSTVSYWERSGTVPEEHIHIVAEALGVTTRELRARAAELIRDEPIQSKERLEYWRDALLLDNDLNPIAKAVLAAFPIFWNDALKAVVVSPTKYRERAGWVDGFDINEAWELVNNSGYVDAVDDGIFRLVLK